MKRIARLIHIPLLLIAILIVIALPGEADAYMLCRSDPIVVLSNGTALDLTTSLSTLPMQVEEVHYELHVPAGLSMVVAIHTPAWLTSQETFSFFADQAPGQYHVITSASTTEGDAQVTADATLVSLLNIKLGHYTASGIEGQVLSLFFHT